MMAPDTFTPTERPPRWRRLTAIQHKLEIVLRSKNKRLEPYHAEVVSIIDALALLNRDSGVLTKRGHLGDFDLD